jgi:large subunit ribosomal protein L35
VPKQKTNSAAKKRFKVTGAGRLLRRHAMKSHNLEKKSSKRKRAFGHDVPLDSADAREVRKLLALPRARRR